jgi:hypothetical protein
MSIVITSTTDNIKLIYNGLDRKKICDVTYKNKSAIKSVNLSGITNGKGSYVEVMFDNDEPWTFDVSGDRGMIVDTVDTIAPTDNTDLAAKLAAFIKV